MRGSGSGKQTRDGAGQAIVAFAANFLSVTYPIMKNTSAVSRTD